MALSFDQEGLTSSYSQLRETVTSRAGARLAPFPSVAEH
jgi:hypothetical protein